MPTSAIPFSHAAQLAKGVDPNDPTGGDLGCLLFYRFGPSPLCVQVHVRSASPTNWAIQAGFSRCVHQGVGDVRMALLR